MNTEAVKTRGSMLPDLITGLTTGVANIPDAMASCISRKVKGQLDRTEATVEILNPENVFVATTTLGSSTPAAHEAAQRWLQETPAESNDNGIEKTL
jgi:hypothetical protein